MLTSVKPFPSLIAACPPPALYKVGCKGGTWDAAGWPCPPLVIRSLHFIAGEFIEEKYKISRKKTGVETKQSQERALPSENCTHISTFN